MRKRRGKKTFNWLPESTVIHGFTFKGFLVVVVVIAVVSFINYF